MLDGLVVVADVVFDDDAADCECVADEDVVIVAAVEHDTHS